MNSTTVKIWQDIKLTFSSLVLFQLGLVSKPFLIVYTEKWQKLIEIDAIAILLTILIVGLFALILLKEYQLALKLHVTRRYDALIPVAFGVICGLLFNDFIKSSLALTVLCIGLILTYFLVFIVRLKKSSSESFFLIDKPVESENLDFLDYQEDAHNFAEKVINNKSTESLVFGLDASWGTGKSTYLNFCKNYWKNKCGDYSIIIEFSPIQYSKKEDILDSLIHEIIKKLKRDYYLPEIERDLEKYIKIIKGVTFELYGIKLTVGGNEIRQDLFLKLTESLKSLNKKIIVIIDDLDRLTINEIKPILDMVKNSLSLPNLSYILCYETENINSFNNDLKIKTGSYTINGNIDVKGAIFPKKINLISTEASNYKKIGEYMEKVVNIKKTLVIPREKVRDYLRDEIKKMASRQTEDNKSYSLVSPESLKKIFKAIDVIFNSKEYHQYSSHIGDLRKVKRLLNIMKMQIDDLDLTSVDIMFEDLLHLMLIYINYPSLFRKIYLTETEGANGFFSINWDMLDKEGSRYKNSENYKYYLETLSEPEKFLVEKIFSEKKFKDDKLDAEKRANWAAFNGGKYASEPKNLEDYLSLITKNKKPKRGNAYNYHFNNLLKVIDDEMNVADLMDSYYSDFKNGEGEILVFFRILSSNLDKISFDVGQQFIDYLLVNLKSFSLYERDDVESGFRHNTRLYFASLLNQCGWRDEDGERHASTKENIKTIADRIFGEDMFKDKGILDLLAKPKEKRGVLGIYDLIGFRLTCSHDREGNFFNLYDSLGYHEDQNAKTDGRVYDLTIQQMREISQRCFSIFKELYIKDGICIFDEINKLDAKDIFAKSNDYIQSQLKNKKLNVKIEIERTKTIMRSFVLYQLTNAKIESGVGCGYYDPDGDADKKGIKTAMNEYLFNVCFNISKDSGKENFLDYLLSNLKRVWGRGEKTEYIPSIDNYLQILDEEILRGYWANNRNSLIEYSKNVSKNIYQHGYTASYEDDLQDIFSILDEFIKKSSQQEDSSKSN